MSTPPVHFLLASLYPNTPFHPQGLAKLGAFLFPTAARRDSERERRPDVPDGAGWGRWRRGWVWKSLLQTWALLLREMDGMRRVVTVCVGGQGHSVGDGGLTCSFLRSRARSWKGESVGTDLIFKGQTRTRICMSTFGRETVSTM